MTPPEAGSVAVELERMRGTFETGLTKLHGKLDVLVERSDHTDRRLVAAEAEAAKLATRVSALERRVWTASGVAAALGAGGGVLAALLGG
ncbi:hypothetical protein [Streptomyces vilmorinianum]|uniref:hypothetical protein n=1 Tax=Streptomyces vilmorinianum TaxID=3051092 RepID=UPI0010FB527D|nr:hypothetical protein [Streptomyces vilmorinianum]